MKLYEPFRPFTAILIGLLVLCLFVWRAEPIIQKANTGFTNAQVEDVYQRLFVNSGLGQKPPLHIANTSMVNAWTDGEDVTITTGILKKMANVDEIAMVLAHELGHVINYDSVHEAMEEAVGYPIDGRYKEAAADKIGAYIMMRSGFDECKGREIMQVFRDNFGDDAGAEGHPDNAFRLDQLNLPQCHKTFFSNWF